MRHHRSVVQSMVLAALLATPAAARVVTEVMDAAGDGAFTPLGLPQDVVVDPSGTVYVASLVPPAVFRLPPGGPPEVLLDASGDGAGNPLGFPSGLALDAAGNLYVAAQNDRVFRVTPGGAVTVILDATGDGAGNDLDCTAPASCHVAVDGAGVVYVSEEGFGDYDSQIFRVPPGGPATVALDGSGGGTGARLDCSFSGCRMTVDAGNAVYVASPRGDAEVFRIDPGGAVSALGVGVRTGSVNDVTIDSLGRVAVSGDQGAARRDAGVWTSLLYLGFTGPPDLWGIDVDGADVLYVSALGPSGAFRLAPGGVTQILDTSGDGQGNAFDCSGRSYCAGPAVWATDPPRVYVAGTSSDNVFEIAFQCPTAPRPGCRRPVAARAARLRIRDRPGGEKDDISLSLAKVAATTFAELGNPPAGTDYTLCLYDDVSTSPRLVFEGSAPGGGLCGGPNRPCWKASQSGFSYEDGATTPDGIRSMVLRSGTDGKAKGKVRGRGSLLASSTPMPSLPLALPVRAQLAAPDGICWEADFGVAPHNDASYFVARGE